MPLVPDSETLETDRLILRRAQVEDAPVYRELWTERDPRVPPHRQIDSDGRPTVEDIAARISADADDPRARLLTVVRKDTADVIGYCGLTDRGNGSPEEPELAYELLRAAHGHGYATEAAEAVIAWARDAGCRRVRAGVWNWNVASRRVLQKLGFREVSRVEPESVHGYSLLTIKDLSTAG